MSISPDENKNRIFASGVTDKIRIWTLPECQLCSDIARAIRNAGYDVEELNFEEDLENEPIMAQVEIRATYELHEAVPVVQVNRRACTVEEAAILLGVNYVRLGAE